MLRRNNSAGVHAWVEERLSDYIDSQLPPTERTRLEQHLRECEQCRASLVTLRWTVSLVKQAPAPALRRSFVLPLPARRESTFAFSFARLGTALATLLLFAVVGVDLIGRFGGATAPAMAPAQSDAQVAFAATPTALQKLSAPGGAQPTPSPLSTTAAPPAPLLPPAPTQALEGAQKLPSPTAPLRQPSASGVVATALIPTPTATLVPSPTATLVLPTASPLPTIVAQARAEPTRAPVSPPVTNAQPRETPLRVAEIGLFFFAIFFGVLTVFLWRKK